MTTISLITLPFLFASAGNATEPPAEPTAGRHVPPAFPTAPLPEPDDCLRAWDVVPGKVPPFLVSGLPTCRGTLLPAWQARDLLARVAYADAVSDWYTVEVATLTVERDYALLQVEEVRPRWFQRPLPVAVVASGFTILVGYVAVQAWAVSP